MSNPIAVPHPGVAVLVMEARVMEVAAMEGGVAVMVQCPHPNGSWLPLGSEPPPPPLHLLLLPL